MPLLSVAYNIGMDVLFELFRKRKIDLICFREQAATTTVP